MIDSSESWWDAVDDSWVHLLDIIAHHMDMRHAAFDHPGDATSAPTGRSIGDELEHLKSSRDHERLARYFHAAWGMASEAYAWSVPHWGTLCDLCSEEWVFHEERA